MGFIDALALAGRGVDAVQQGKEKRRFQDALMEQKAQESAIDRQMKEAQIGEMTARAESLRTPKPEKLAGPVIGSPEYLAAQEQLEQMRARYRTKPTDPVASHKANRDYDVAHPLPQERNQVATEGERQTAGLLPEIQDASQRLASYSNANALERLAQSGGMFTNWANSPEGQLYNQAADQWLTNVIYAKSGKAVTETEKAQIKRTYIGLPGDNDKTLAAKQHARELAEQGITTQAGRAVPKKAAPVGATGPSADPKAEQRQKWEKARQALVKQGADSVTVLSEIGPRP